MTNLNRSNQTDPSTKTVFPFLSKVETSNFTPVVLTARSSKKQSNDKYLTTLFLF